MEARNKSIAWSFGDFDFMTNNHTAYIADKSGVDACYHPIMDFLNEGPLAFALKEAPSIHDAQVPQFWAVADYVPSTNSEEEKVQFKLNNETFIFTAESINRALCLPIANEFASLATDTEIFDMFRSLGYLGSLTAIGSITRPNLCKEWSFFFDQIVKVFITKCSGFDAITTHAQQIAYALINKRVINFGAIILKQLGTKLAASGTRRQVYYHRFLQIMLNHLFPNAHTDC